MTYDEGTNRKEILIRKKNQILLETNRSLGTNLQYFYEIIRDNHSISSTDLTEQAKNAICYSYIE